MALNLPKRVCAPRINAFLQRVLPVFLLIVFILTLNGAISAHMERNPWSIGDWLIGYQNGFLRRGLTGYLISGVAELLHVNPGKIVVVVLAAAYGVFLFFTWRLLKLQKSLIPHVFLIGSPFIFVFQLHDHLGGYRKEILFFALFSVLVWLARRLQPHAFERFFYAILLWYPLLILSHEMLAIWVPYLLIVYLNIVPLTTKRLVILAAISSLSVMAFGASLFASGTTETVLMINASLHDFGYSHPHGAIAFLGVGAEKAYHSTAITAAEGRYYAYYPQVLLLGCLAFVPVWKNLTQVLAPRWVKPLLHVSIIGAVLCALVGVDWGRFIYASLVPLFLLSLLADTPQSARSYSRKHIAVFAFALALYASSWYIPHAVDANPYRWVPAWFTSVNSAG